MDKKYIIAAAAEKILPNRWQPSSAPKRTLTAEIKSAGIYLVIDVFAMMDYFVIE